MTVQEEVYAIAQMAARIIAHTECTAHHAVRTVVEVLEEAETHVKKKVKESTY